MKSSLMAMVGATLLVASSLGTCGDESSVTWLTDLGVARTVAAERKLPILADFSGSDWCGWCIKLDREVFSQAEFKEYAKANLVLFLADFPRGRKLAPAVAKQNDALLRKYGVEGFPTVLLLDASGRVSRLEFPRARA